MGESAVVWDWNWAILQLKSAHRARKKTNDDYYRKNSSVQHMTEE